MKSSYGYENKVDVVPVINVSLVIVLTLMLIAPFLNPSDHAVDLPQARASEVDDTDRVEITFTLDGEIYIDDHAIALNEVRSVLEPRFAENPEAVAVVKADQAHLYGDVEKLIAEVEAANAPRIAIATQKHKGAVEADSRSASAKTTAELRGSVRGSLR